MKKWIKKHLIAILSVCAVCCFILAFVIPRLSPVRFRKLDTPPGTSYAGIYYIIPEGKVSGILIVIHGWNNLKGELISDPHWQEFARKNNLALFEASYASDRDSLNNGVPYHNNVPANGKILLDAIHELLPGNFPIYLFGHSAGAQYITRFIQWKPELVRAWVANSHGWYSSGMDIGENIPPGLVITGETDGNYQSCWEYFRDGIAQGKKMLWCGVKNMGHYPLLPEPAEFARKYLQCFIDHDDGQLKWVEVELDGKNAGYLPDANLMEDWKKLDLLIGDEEEIL